MIDCRNDASECHEEHFDLNADCATCKAEQDAGDRCAVCGDKINRHAPCASEFKKVCGDCAQDWAG